MARNVKLSKSAFNTTEFDRVIDREFKTFRRHPKYTGIVETISKNFAQKYLDIIHEKYVLYFFFSFLPFELLFSVLLFFVLSQGPHGTILARAS